MFKAVYAYIGDDVVRMRTKVDSMIEKGVPAHVRAFNLDTFAPGDGDARRIDEACRTAPMGEGRRIVLVRDLAGYPEEEQEAVAALAARMAGAPDTGTTLAVLCNGMDGRTRRYKQLAGLEGSPNGDTLEFKAPKPWQTDGWVEARARERGITLSRTAAQALVELIGDDLQALDSELTKLGLYASGGAVGPDDVEAVVGRRRGESAWDLYRLAVTGEGTAAQQVLERLIASGENAVFLCNAMTRQVLESWQTARLLAQGAGKDAVIKQAGVKAFAADKVMATARGVPLETFPRMLAALKACDLGLKSRGKQDAILLGQALGRLALEAAGAIR